MRNFSNQSGGNSSSGNSGNSSRPSGNSPRPSSGNREHRSGGYKGGQGGGGYNREHRDSKSGGGYRGPSSGGYKGGQGGGNFNREHRDSKSGGGYRGGQGGGYKGGQGGGFNREHRENRGNERHDRGEGQFTPRTGGSWVEVTGRTAEDALDEAARRFNVGKADLKADVVDEGSKGFLGIGSKPAKVRISLKPAAVPAFAEGVLSRLLRGMSLPDKVKIQKDSDGNTVLNIQGPSSGTLIGRHGHTLEALQYLVSKVVQRMTSDERAIMIVDVENYLERQKDKLKELAVNLAQKAKETGVEIPMRPMSSKDRRVVHMTLKDHEHVTTESRGEGLRRKVVIVPKVKAEQVTPEAAAAAEAAGDVDPGNTAPPSDSQSSESQSFENQPIESQPPASMPSSVEMVADKPEPGNAIPKEKEIDDSIGNRV